MSQEFGYENDPLRLAIISYITSNPNSTLEDIFRGIPASHTKVRHWLLELLRSETITSSDPIGSIPLSQITWSAGGSLDVIWSGGVNVTITDNTVEKTGGSPSLYDAGAYTTKLLQGGDGYIEAEYDIAGDRFLGLDVNAPVNQNWTSMDFALWFRSTGLTIYENGSFKTASGPAPSNGDILRIEIESGTIKYKKNGVTFYTSLNSPNYPLYGDCSIKVMNRKIIDAKISGDWQ